MNLWKCYVPAVVCFCLLMLLGPAWPVEKKSASGLVLDTAVMCETVEGIAPVNRAVVFSLDIGEVYCFTSFTDIHRETVVYHKWYRCDQLSTSRRLTLKPPRWSTVSKLQFREADKGPWRVEIVDKSGQILKTIRFSIVD
ncbi:MAG: DUF2914 domain-containing protein [Desulfobacterales bacterium]